MRHFVFSLLMGLVTLGSASSAAIAASCNYDVSPLPVISGTVTRVTTDGVLLQDGTDLILPESLLPHVRLDTKVTVRGLKGTTGHKVWAFAIEDHSSLICPSKGDVHKGAYPGSPSYDVIGHDEQEKP
ncbi:MULTISPECIES: hypothetical protein [unclassified Saccharibacter]|uniref:hypothetical protein n=1 Tax=unclassified Saccharibacter TaxID=2648722 RepID=UPI00132A465E|nr:MULTISPECIES: hypothetical protein [unclassified Saccharibacter]MXV35109.1 hypothetical protein [Saccharibacter sp. EH611]MXV57344.1 hypothetical protein [Saccharibacter sp. EH70]MXV64795.1 hypothetical protein [Saccharibacter sp. EH60]